MPIMTNTVAPIESSWQTLLEDLPASVQTAMELHAVVTRAQAERFIDYLVFEEPARAALGVPEGDLRAARLSLVPLLTAVINFCCCDIPIHPGGPPLTALINVNPIDPNRENLDD
jgi:hypothetical protein